MKKLLVVLRLLSVTLAVIATIGCDRLARNPVAVDVQKSSSEDSIGSSPRKPKAEPNSSSRFPTDQCTWYAASEFDKVAPWPGCNWGGNAGTWIANASAAGWRTLAYPTYYPHAAGYTGIPSGSIVVWTGGGYGHVAVVRYVFQNGIYIQEKNWPYGSGVSSWRLLFWPDVLNRSGYKFSGYIPPWRK